MASLPAISSHALGRSSFPFLLPFHFPFRFPFLSPYLSHYPNSSSFSTINSTSDSYYLDKRKRTRTSGNINGRDGERNSHSHSLTLQLHSSCLMMMHNRYRNHNHYHYHNHNHNHYLTIRHSSASSSSSSSFSSSSLSSSPSPSSSSSSSSSSTRFLSSLPCSASSFFDSFPISSFLPHRSFPSSFLGQLSRFYYWSQGGDKAFFGRYLYDKCCETSFNSASNESPASAGAAHNWKELAGINSDLLDGQFYVIAIHFMIVQQRATQHIDECKQIQLQQQTTSVSASSSSVGGDSSSSSVSRMCSEASFVFSVMFESFWVDLEQTIGERVGSMMISKTTENYQKHLFGFMQAMRKAIEIGKEKGKRKGKKEGEEEHTNIGRGKQQGQAEGGEEEGGGGGGSAVAAVPMHMSSVSVLSPLLDVLYRNVYHGLVNGLSVPVTAEQLHLLGEYIGMNSDYINGMEWEEFTRLEWKWIEPNTIQKRIKMTQTKTEIQKEPEKESQRF